MVKKVRLTRRANQKLFKIAEYLEEEFGLSSAQSFLIQIIEFLDILANYPNLGTCIDSEKSVYGFVLSKQITIFYRLTETEIIILNLFDNRTNPKKNKY